MSRLNNTLEYRLRALDPCLSAYKASDLYDQVVRLASIEVDSNYEPFAQKITDALAEVYGINWLLNPDIDEKVLMKVLYASLAQNTKEKVEEAPSGRAWYDGDICRFATCKSKGIPVGKTVYIRDDKTSDQTLKFIDDSIRPRDTVRIDFSVDLSVEIDEIGRLLYPSHFFDNLFLEEQDSSSISLPPNIVKGRAYITTPSIKTLEEYVHFAIPSLNTLKIDKDAKLIQFGSRTGKTNVEIVSGFVLSFDNDELVNAWLRIENTVGKSLKKI